jgi:hypothetical protein
MGMVFLWFGLEFSNDQFGTLAELWKLYTKDKEYTKVPLIPNFINI